MTAFPYWVDINEPLSAAEKLMQSHEISHLPVKQNGDLVGVIAHYDIQKAKNDLKDASAYKELKIENVCVLDAYIVDLDEPLDNVVLHMANFHIGSALVMRNDRLAGVFTVNDACRCFAEFLRYQFRPLNGDDVA